MCTGSGELRLDGAEGRTSARSLLLRVRASLGGAAEGCQAHHQREGRHRPESGGSFVTYVWLVEPFSDLFSLVLFFVLLNVCEQQRPQRQGGVMLLLLLRSVFLRRISKHPLAKTLQANWLRFIIRSTTARVPCAMPPAPATPCSHATELPPSTCTG